MSEDLDRAPPLEPGLIAALTDLAVQAGMAILAARSADLSVREKPDHSLVTAADEAAEAVILAGLARIMPGVPVVSEEQVTINGAPTLGSVFFLTDPLDGTREFVAGRDEFTVNIAFIVNGTPMFGVIAAPALGLAWRGGHGRGVQRLRGAAGPESAQQVHARRWPERNGVALVSRSHLDADSAALLGRLGLTGQPFGSALKFCRLAEGAADLYPRLAPTMEWDVAAGHALLAATGGAVVTPEGRALSYGQANNGFHVPAFVACADSTAMARILSDR